MTQLNNNLFGKSIALKILICLRENSVENYCSKISKFINCENGWCSRCVKDLAELGLIKKVRKNSLYALELTKIGEEITDMIIEISKKIENGHLISS